MHIKSIMENTKNAIFSTKSGSSVRIAIKTQNDIVVSKQMADS